MAKFLKIQNAPMFMFKCPGCKAYHHIDVDPAKRPFWQFNGDVENPTVTPSLVVDPDNPQYRCHSFITDGKIQFLSDSGHALAGQTVELPDCDFDDEDTP